MYTGLAPVSRSRAVRASCFSTSSSTTFMGRLMMMPSAPWALCSQMKVTLSRKFGVFQGGHGHQELVGEEVLETCN